MLNRRSLQAVSWHVDATGWPFLSRWLRHCEEDDGQVRVSRPNFANFMVMFPRCSWSLPHQKSKFGTQIQTKILKKPFGRFSGYKFAGASRETNSKSTVHIGPARPITFNTFTRAVTCTPLKQLNLDSVYTSQVP